MRAGGGGGVELLTETKNSIKKCSWGLKTQTKILFQKCSWGSETHAQNNLFLGGGGILGCLGRPTPPPGGRAGSENDTLLPMTMTCDRLKFWSLAVKSYHLETLAAEEYKIKIKTK